MPFANRRRRASCRSLDRVAPAPRLTVPPRCLASRLGRKTYNQRLSEARVDSVADALVSAGVNRRRLRTRGFGKTLPVAPNAIRGRDNPAGRAKNRRVEVIIENSRRPRAADDPRYDERRDDGRRRRDYDHRDRDDER